MNYDIFGYPFILAAKWYDIISANSMTLNKQMKTSKQEKHVGKPKI